MKAISAEGMRAIFAQETDEVFAFALKMTHAEWVEEIRLIGDETDMTYDGHNWIAFPFQTSLPSQEEGQLPTVDITVDNIDRLFIDELRSIQTPPDVELFLFRRSFDGTDTLELPPMVLKAGNLKYDDTKLTVTLTLDADYLNEPATKDRFLPGNSPGLFK